MKEPNRKIPMMASVKRTFLLRSGVLKILPRALNTSSSCTVPGDTWVRAYRLSAPGEKVG
jgi:hypothetical protein